MTSLSILCPVYRTERFLPATIASVLAQTREDWELVVVDNGCSDEAADIVASFGPDPRIVLRRHENRGMDGGFSSAAAGASGRYVLPLASDDLLAPTACARFVAILDADPGVDAVSCDADLLHDARGVVLARGWLRSVGVRSARPERPVTLREVVGGRDLYYAAAFRRTAWDAAGGYVDGVASDLGLWLRLLGSGHDVRVTPERLGVYRVRGDSLSRDSARSGFDAQVERVLVAAVDGSDDPDLHAALARRLRRRRALVALAAARGALRDGDVEAARRHARQAAAHRPTARSVAVLAGLLLAPGLLRGVHPHKRRLQAALTRTHR